MMDEKIIGIDFGDTTVSVVLITAEKTGQRIETTVQTSLSDGNIRQGLSEAMAAVREKVDFQAAACVVSIPDACVSYRTVQLPFADRRKIDKVLPFELEPLLPVPVAEVTVDYYVSAAASDGNAQTTVFVAAVLQAALKAYLEDLAAVGLEPDLVVPRGYATAAVLAKDTPSALVAEKAGDKVFVSFISNNCVQAIRTVTLPREPDRLISSLCARLRHSILAWEETCQGDFDSLPVFVTGPDWPDEEFTGAVESHLGLPVRQVDVEMKKEITENGRVDGFDRDRVNRQTQMALSLALLKLVRRPNLNFRRSDLAVFGKWRQYSGALAGTGLLLLLVLMLGLAGVFYERQQIQRQIASLDARIVNIFQECCPHVQSLHQLRAELQQLKGGNGLPADMSRKAHVVDVLNDISRLVPSAMDAVVTRLVVGPEEVMLTGHTDAFNAVDTIKNRLGESDFFSKVDISSATMNRQDQRVHFNIRVTLL